MRQNVNIFRVICTRHALKLFFRENSFYFLSRVQQIMFFTAYAYFSLSETQFLTLCARRVYLSDNFVRDGRIVLEACALFNAISYLLGVWEKLLYKSKLKSMWLYDKKQLWPNIFFLISSIIYVYVKESGHRSVIWLKNLHWFHFYTS